METCQNKNKEINVLSHIILNNNNLNRSELDNKNIFKLLSVNKVRKLLGISYNRTLKLINSGDIEYVIVDNKLMVPVVQLWNYISKTKTAEHIHNKFDSIENEINSILKEVN